MNTLQNELNANFACEVPPYIIYVEAIVRTLDQFPLYMGFGAAKILPELIQ